VVVLLPYAQLMPQGARAWARQCPDGFAPHFETTQNWCQRLAAGVVTAASDYAADPALDALTARALLEQAGWRAQAESAAPLLLDSMRELAGLVAGIPPSERAAWAVQARSTALSGLDAQAMRLEAAVAQVAVVWAANSSYPSDILFSSSVMASVDLLIAIPGFHPDPLLAGLQRVWGERMVFLPLHQGIAPADERIAERWRFHEATDVQDEALRATACALRHLEAGRSPVAVAVIDRALTRRVRALLDSHGVQIRDETGWKLSTTRAGAHVMVAVRACVWHASTDAVLDWLKHVPSCAPSAVNALETALRRRPQRLWRHVPLSQAQAEPQISELIAQVEQWRGAMQGTRTLEAWVQALAQLLRDSGQWELLDSDVAGREVLQALRLQAPTSFPADALWAGRRFSLSDYTHWLDQVLESGIFKPQYPLNEQVVLLPLAQMLGREFAAVVLPGCDEQRLPPSPDLAGLWTATQRAALGLPARAVLEASLRAAWSDALARPEVDVLWRRSDEGGEPLLASPLVQLAQVQLCEGTSGSDTPPHQPPQVPEVLTHRTLQPCVVLRPSPSAPELARQRISATAYHDLRQCPYRYFGLRLLGLREAEELEGEIDKRDVGNWLHGVLQRFHADLDQPGADREQRRAWLDVAATEEAQAQALAEDEFLPYQTAWPQMREGYLKWLEKHEGEGWRYEDSERDEEQRLGPVTVYGRLDRIDRARDDTTLLVDYKTESEATTRARVAEPMEDTQLAFYAALRGEDVLRAAYVNIGERDGSRTYAQEDIVEARDALIEGLLSDMALIAQGAVMPAMGEGRVCETCAARGLCRKDFWAEEAKP
jgi:ATP-dependent helicase/nuclease subunit B